MASKPPQRASDLDQSSDASTGRTSSFGSRFGTKVFSPVRMMASPIFGRRKDSSGSFPVPRNSISLAGDDDDDEIASAKAVPVVDETDAEEALLQDVLSIEKTVFSLKQTYREAVENAHAGFETPRERATLLSILLVSKACAAVLSHFGQFTHFIDSYFDTLMLSCALLVVLTTHKRASKIKHRSLSLQTTFESKISKVRVPITSIQSSLSKSIQGSADEQEKMDKLKGFRLNFFADLPNVQFSSVYDPLTSDQKTKFHLLKDVEFPKQHAKRPLPFPERFHQLPDDFTLLRFLVSDSYDVEKAGVRLAEAVVWRQTSLIDEFVTNPDIPMLERYNRLRPRICTGPDFESRIVMFERLGEFFGSPHGSTGLTMPQWKLCYAYDLCLTTDYFRKESARVGFPHHRLHFIGDLSGIRMFAAARLVNFILAMSKEVERHFPEMSEKIFLVNAPSFLSRLWPLVKKGLDKRTAENVSISSTFDKEASLKFMSPEMLLEELGGTCDRKMHHVPKKVQLTLDAWPLSPDSDKWGIFNPGDK